MKSKDKKRPRWNKFNLKAECCTHKNWKQNTCENFVLSKKSVMGVDALENERTLHRSQGAMVASVGGFPKTRE